MLPYPNRLIKRKDIEAVHKYGTFYSFGSVIAKIKKNDLSVSRVAVVVGIKYSKKAVERNQAKRMIREAAREILASLERGEDIVLIAKKNTREGAKKTTWQTDVQEIFKKAGLVLEKNIKK
jgi:ribonuclease P protein component